MARKKSKKTKSLRRKTEILKAHAKSGFRGEFIAGDAFESGAQVKQPKKLTHRLHIKEIKTDLVKTVLFAVFVVILLFLLDKL
jgi:hypothetical protein